MPEQNYEKYNHAEAIRQQIKHVNHLITEVDTEDSNSFKQYFSKAFMGLASLEAMVKPFRDDDYSSDLEDVNPMTMSKADKLSLILETLEDIMEFLHEENLFYAQRTGRRKT